MTINSSTSHLYPVKGKYLDYILEKLKFHNRATIHLLKIIFNELLTLSCHNSRFSTSSPVERSKYHTTLYWKGLLCSSRSLLKMGSTSAGCLGPHPVWFSTSRDRHSTSKGSFFQCLTPSSFKTKQFNKNRPKTTHTLPSLKEVSGI